MADINVPEQDRCINIPATIYAIDSVLMGKQTTFHIKKILTGDVIVCTATEAAQDTGMVSGMSPEDACLIGMWFGKDQSKSAIEYLTQEINKKAG